MKRTSKRTTKFKLLSTCLVIMMLLNVLAPIRVAAAETFTKNFVYGNTVSGSYWKIENKDDYKENRNEEDFENAKITEKDIENWWSTQEALGQHSSQKSEQTSAASALMPTYNSFLEQAFNDEKDLYEAIEFANTKSREQGQEMFESAEEQEEDSSLADDVGGMLLKPVFALVNFIADACLGIVQDFMDEDATMKVMGDEKVDFSGEPNYTDSIKVTLSGVQYPMITYSPEKIFSGEIGILSIDFISGDTENGPLSSVRRTIASWYKALVLLAAIGLLSVLIYTGIKIIISSNAKDKAKYKEWILNWFIAVAILFCMHYIMAFIITVTDEINILLNSNNGNSINAQVFVNGIPYRFQTNLMGLVRFMVQSDSFIMKVGYEVMYIALIVFTFKFTVTYLKRMLNMAFLTLIAPIVALTYPIDKMTDGNAQGFDMWLKEYIFNALLQPMHYLMYYILVSSAIGIAASNPIYGIVVLAFMTEAERLLKSIFGFGKAKGGTVGGMASAFTAGALMSGIKSIAKMAGGGNTKGGSVGQGKTTNENPSFDNVKDTGIDNFAEDDAEERMNEADKENGAFEQEPGREAFMTGYKPNTEDQYAGMSREQYRQHWEEQGYDEDSINYMVDDRYGNTSDDSTSTQTTGTGASSPDNGEPIRNKNSRIISGVGAVGKSLARPIWDFDQSAKYNGKRWARRVAKGAVGFSVGTAAAAVQAGMSITDGKYHPVEGLASFAAGFSGGGRAAEGIVNGVTGIGRTFEEGYHSADNETQNAKYQEKLRERYHEDFKNRDDVKAVFKDKFGEEKLAEMQARAKTYTDRGYTDPKEMAKLMKSSNKLGWDDKKVISAMEFKKTLQSQGASGVTYDPSKQKSYIDSVIKSKKDISAADASKLRKTYENAFKAVAQLDDTL